jgi:hypothetical protein
VGVRVGKGVKVGTGVGVARRGGTSVTARLSPILTMTSRLIIPSMMRFRRDLERCTMSPVSVCYSTCHYSTAMRRHKRTVLVMGLSSRYSRPLTFWASDVSKCLLKTTTWPLFCGRMSETWGVFQHL